MCGNVTPSIVPHPSSLPPPPPAACPSPRAHAVLPVASLTVSSYVFRHLVTFNCSKTPAASDSRDLKVSSYHTDPRDLWWERFRAVVLDVVSDGDESETEDGYNLSGCLYKI